MIEKALLEKVKIQTIITDQRAFNLKKKAGGVGGANSLAVQWLGLSAFTARAGV